MSEVLVLPSPPKRSIALRNICKDYHTPSGHKRVLSDVSFDVKPGEKIAVLGRNGAGKSTLVKLIGGVEKPTSGSIHRGMTMSWPVAFGGGFEATMTGLDNIRFIARIYNCPIDETVEKVDDFAELGSSLLMPVKAYSSGMRARLAFALTLAIDFECFLIDEVISVGDQRFQRKSHDALFVKRQNCAMILVSHDINMVKTYCNKALLLKGGRGLVFEDLDYAINVYSSF